MAVSLVRLHGGFRALEFVEERAEHVERATIVQVTTGSHVLEQFACDETRVAVAVFPVLDAGVESGVNVGEGVHQAALPKIGVTGANRVDSTVDVVGSIPAGPTQVGSSIGYAYAGDGMENRPPSPRRTGAT
jgi:hypothetical protein